MAIEVIAEHRDVVPLELHAGVERDQARISRPSSITISPIHDAKHLLLTPITHQHSPINGFIILRPMFLICSPGTSRPARFRTSGAVISRSS
ncbi:hypothetical protein [Burkholderia sp. D-99]|uniref:hypothetical protein n=1 Tax=Burkholderia sp. D-99 TaxID=2717316 RepID=UPI0014244F2D|nr:hypothetical protein [Burkholderia sp. D-99]NHV26417.1 hypothetical protein [Burkholderia sp. D-99]